jgi:hypothetical protein
MHPDDLKAIWICHECKMKFVFHSDTADHKNLTERKLQETDKTFIKRGEREREYLLFPLIVPVVSVTFLD